jgi:hypothetical protein
MVISGRLAPLKTGESSVKCSVPLFVCLTTALSAGAAFAQAPDSSTSIPAAKKDAPVAFVYVSNYLGENQSDIVAYSAAARTED